LNARKLLLLDLELLALVILASRAALLIHEVGGHALPAWVFGGERITIHLSTLGGGSVDWDPEFHGWRGAVTSLGGIFLNLATGALAWILSRRLKRAGPARASLLIFGVGSVAGAIVYLANGFYYGSGDPVGFAPDTGDLSRAQWIWILFLPPALGVGWLAGRHYIELLSSHLTLERPAARAGWLLGTAGVAGLAYGALWMGLRQPDKEGSTREWRIEREIAQETQRRAQARTPPPPAAVDPVPPAPPVQVRPEEVKDRVPSPLGPCLLYATFALAGLASLRRPPGPALPASIPPAWSIGMGILAAGVLVAFRCLG
jgi:hypothetical protein